MRFVSMFTAFSCALVSAGQDSPFEYDKSRVGVLDDGRVVVPTNQVLSPAGWQVEFPGRPTDLALSRDGRHLAVLNRYNVVLIDIDKREVVQTVLRGRVIYDGDEVLSAGGDGEFIPACR